MNTFSYFFNVSDPMWKSVIEMGLKRVQGGPDVFCPSLTRVHPTQQATGGSLLSYVSSPGLISNPEVASAPKISNFDDNPLPRRLEIELLIFGRMQPLDLVRG
jgi:hypothetical protein